MLWKYGLAFWIGFVVIAGTGIMASMQRSKTSVDLRPPPALLEVTLGTFAVVCVNAIERDVVLTLPPASEGTAGQVLHFVKQGAGVGKLILQPQGDDRVNGVVHAPVIISEREKRVEVDVLWDNDSAWFLSTRITEKKMHVVCPRQL